MAASNEALENVAGQIKLLREGGGRLFVQDVNGWMEELGVDITVSLDQEPSMVVFEACIRLILAEREARDEAQSS